MGTSHLDAARVSGIALPISRSAVSRSGLNPLELAQLVQSTETPLRTLAGALILITGATGWFGVWLLDTLCAADDMYGLGLRIVPVSRDPCRFLARFPGFAGDRRISWIKSDVRHFPLETRIFSHVIHAAADTGVTSDRDTPSNIFETIVDGTRRALAAAGPHCKSFLLLSSGAVYGPARPELPRFIETQTGGPDPSLLRNCYAEGKRAAEQACAISAATGVNIRIARCFAFVGPHMPFDRHFAIGNFISDAVSGLQIRVTSDGRPQRSYLYMTDLVRALLVILINGSTGRTYNVGSDNAVTIGQLAHCVDRVVGGCGVILGGVRSSPEEHYVPDTTRLKVELGCLPQISLDDAIYRTAAWYRAQRRN